MLNCPKCKTTLSQIQLKNVETDFCKACMGVFLDDNELQTIFKHPKVKDTIPDWAKEVPYICPKCKVKMLQFNYLNSKIEVEMCNSCSGLWLDKSELDKLGKVLKKKKSSTSDSSGLTTLLAGEIGFEILWGALEAVFEGIFDI